MASLRPDRSVAPVAALAIFVGLTGCAGGDGISTYSVPRTTDKSGPVVEYRILGAVYPADNPVWFFKLTGTAEELAKHVADFDKFIASVKLKPDNTVPDFKLPDGWTRGGPRSVTTQIPGGGSITVNFDETIKVGNNEITVSKADGGAVDNVNRWADQVGAARVSAGELGRYTSEIQADGTKGLRVDVKGTKNPAVRRGPMMGGGR